MSNRKFNPALALIIGLPSFAVVASVGTAVVAVTRGDPVLPGEYHWEGQTLDRDFAMSQRAVALNMGATLHLRPTGGECHASLRLDGPMPAAIEVRLTHISQPSLDRAVQLKRIADTADYSAPCSPLPSAQWHVELTDLAKSWSFREEAAGELATVEISTHPAGSPVAWP